MNKLIFLIGICWSSGSCSQSSISTEGNPLKNVIDTLQSRTQSRPDMLQIDVLTASPDKYKFVLENDHLRVIEYTLKPGEKDNPHTHRAKTSYVISGGTFRVYPENKETFEYVEVQGVTEWSDRTSKHYVENVGNTTITLLFTEIKSAR